MALGRTPSRAQAICLSWLGARKASPTTCCSSTPRELLNSTRSRSPSVRKLFATRYGRPLTPRCASNHARPGETVAGEDYPVAFWVVVEKEDETPDVIRMSSKGFVTGSVELGKTMCDVVVSDSNNDGILGVGDWWELRSENAKPSGSRTIGDYAWSGGKAWMLELDGTNGRKATVLPFDPGVTEQEDLAKRDRLREDRLAVRAAKPIRFRKDVDAALKDVAGKNSPYFLKFETDWCGPCKDMAAFVFTAKDVADAAEGLTCVIVDGDEHKT